MGCGQKRRRHGNSPSAGNAGEKNQQDTRLLIYFPEGNQFRMGAEQLRNNVQTEWAIYSTKADSFKCDDFFIEVKGTSMTTKKPAFHMSYNEYKLMKVNKEKYKLIYMKFKNIKEINKIFKMFIDNNLDELSTLLKNETIIEVKDFDGNDLLSNFQFNPKGY